MNFRQVKLSFAGPFGRMVGAELVLAVAIFLAAGILTSLPAVGYAAFQDRAGII